MSATPPSPDLDIAALCALVTRQRDLCEQGQWRVTIGGREVILRDTAVKVLAWLDKFKGVGDVVVNYDPHHFALPWAGVRFLLKVRDAHTLLVFDIAFRYARKAEN